MLRRARAIPLFGLLFAACAAGPPDSLDGFGEVEDGGDDEGSSTAAEPSASQPDDGSTDTGEPMPDLPASDGEACGRIDLLFVIDNSASMADEQANLVASFPGFIAGIESILPSTDYHVGVVTTDANEWNGPGCRRIGALTTATGGEASSATQCGPYASGQRFMTADDDLDETFACAAQVGVDGDGLERPMDAIAATLDPFAAELGGCNAEFLRDDALLVLVLITDEEDEDASQGDPGEWRANVMAAQGDEDRIVVLALVGHDKPNDCIASQWDGMNGAEIAPRLVEFAEGFAHGHVGDVCAPSYTAFFAEAIDGIAKACDVTVPVAD